MGSGPKVTGGGGGGGNPDWFPKDAPDDASGRHDEEFWRKHGNGKYKLARLLPWLLSHVTIDPQARRTRLLDETS